MSIQSDLQHWPRIGRKGRAWLKTGETQCWVCARQLQEHVPDKTGTKNLCYIPVDDPNRFCSVKDLTSEWGRMNHRLYQGMAQTTGESRAWVNKHRGDTFAARVG